MWGGGGGAGKPENGGVTPRVVAAEYLAAFDGIDLIAHVIVIMLHLPSRACWPA